MIVKNCIIFNEKTIAYHFFYDRMSSAFNLYKAFFIDCGAYIIILHGNNRKIGENICLSYRFCGCLDS